jgi:hypothetical protein
MSSYIAQLERYRAQRDAEQAQHEKEKRAAANVAARERLTPLEERLARMLATIPVAVQREGLSLPALQDSLRGRWRGNCHPGELGAALRKLGYKRERGWGGGAVFRALWYPAH